MAAAVFLDRDNRKALPFQAGAQEFQIGDRESNLLAFPGQNPWQDDLDIGSIPAPGGIWPAAGAAGKKT
ncbi:hypothetical protein [Accumulibacter sp.]|uniref:hypothetical protein n=1 Tax=Accumulibacter sp. TaxID=2053492 RepID=UPI002D1FBBCD|nr:hypothetical protein [Accumulibacter sp.]